MLLSPTARSALVAKQLPPLRRCLPRIIWHSRKRKQAPTLMTAMLPPLPPLARSAMTAKPSPRP